MMTTGRVYESYEQIPDRSEYLRVGKVCERARRKVLEDAAALTDEEISSLRALGNIGEAEAAMRACGEARLAPHRGAQSAQSRTTNRGIGIDAERFAEIIATAIRSATDPLRERVARLEARPANAPSVVWRGIWKPGTPYLEGHLVTRGGSLWLCTTSTPNGNPPGQSPDVVLIVKKGDYSRAGDTE
jgi:hypothetical protein